MLKIYEYRGGLVKFDENNVPEGAVLHTKAKKPADKSVEDEKPAEVKTKARKAPSNKARKAGANK